MDVINTHSKIFANYCDAVRQLRDGKFSISILDAPPNEQIEAFSTELKLLAEWLECRFEEFHKLQEVSAEISSGNLLDDVLESIYNSFHKIIPYDRIGCALISDDRTRVQAFWAKTNAPEKMKIARGYSAILYGSSLETILHTAEPRILNDLEAYLEEHPNSHSTKLIVAEGILSSLTCPLLVDGKSIGFLFFSSMGKNTYLDIHQRVFLYIARQVSVLIEKSRLYQKIYNLNLQLTQALDQLKIQSSRDSLTGILNRSSIMEFLGQQLQQAKRKKQQVSIVMIDIDFFKSINDSHGHFGGDMALKEITKDINRNLRDCDRLGRFGGEEFLVVLGDTNAESAFKVSERIRKSVAELNLKYNGIYFKTTISLGVMTSHLNDNRQSDELIAQADAALYQAKRSGRNRVVMAENNEAIEL